MPEPVNLLACTSEAWRDTVVNAMKLGEHDARLKFGSNRATAREIKAEMKLRLSITGCRNGHLDMLVAAYRAGRFHVNTWGQ
jgi:hypothetical protein